jgi:hypothetical protein
MAIVLENSSTKLCLGFDCKKSGQGSWYSGCVQLANRKNASRLSPLTSVHTSCGTHPSFCSLGVRVLSTGLKVAGLWSWTLTSNLGVKNAWSYTFTSPYTFMTCIGTHLTVVHRWYLNRVPDLLLNKWGTSQPLLAGTLLSQYLTSEAADVTILWHWRQPNFLVYVLKWK